MKHKIVDANGKEFEISLADITDMTTDVSDNSIQLEDADKFAMGSFQPSIVDSEGNEVDAAKLMDSVKSGEATLPTAIDVLFEATHSGVNRNNWNYHSDSMLKDTSSWKFPYAKPFLKNHDMYSEPMGRARDAYHGVSEFNNERDCINVVFRITDKEAIEKFLDGRYRTMSIGGKVGHVQCSICGKDILKDGIFKFCGHWRGETYAGQKAIWNGRDIEYKEGSVVNSPADDWAQVKKISLVNSESNKDDEENQGEAATNNAGTGAKDSEEDLAGIVDSVVPTETEDSTVADNSQETLKGEGAADSGVSDDNDETNDSDTAEDSDEVKELKAQLTTKDEELRNINSKVEELNTKVSDLEEQLTTSKAENESLKDEYSNSQRTVINMAVAYKTTMAKRIADEELIKGELVEDSYSDRVKELVGKSAKELQALNDAVNVITAKSVDKPAPKTITQVTSPALANSNDEHSINDEEKDNGKEESRKSYKDIEDSIIDSIFR
nr:MAG TPA: chromosome segregation ATPase [Caudoviricetes sp.]